MDLMLKAATGQAVFALSDMQCTAHMAQWSAWEFCLLAPRPNKMGWSAWPERSQTL
jgi:hypothetical protein